jgi:hypothetical protein
MTREAEGRLSFVFRGRISGRDRQPGRYLLTAKATDAAGNVSEPETAAFRLRPR